LIHVLRVLEHVKGLSFTHFEPKDVVRHPLVQRIVEAYAREDALRSSRNPDLGQRSDVGGSGS